MMFRIEQSAFDPDTGFLYYVAFKPNMEIGAEEIFATMPVQVGISLSETSELASLAFDIPKQCRNPQALSFICKDDVAGYVEPHVSIALPGASGDAVLDVPGRLDIDIVGRIVGMQLQWMPEVSN